MRAPILAAAALCAACSSLVGIEDIEVPEIGLDVGGAQLELTAGKETQMAVQTTVREGGPQDLTLTVTGLPPGVTATISPASMKSGDRAMLVLRATRETPEARHELHISAATPTVTEEAALSLQIIAVSEFALQLPEPRAREVAAGASASYQVTSSITSGRPEPMTLSASRLPAGVTASFQPATIRAGESSTLTLTAAQTMGQIDSTEFTVEGRAESAMHTASGWIKVTNDYTVEVGAPSGPLRAGGTLKLPVKATATSGPAQAVTLDVAGLPAGVTATFEPAVLTTGASGTLTLVATPAAAQAEATATIGGMAAPGRRTARVTFTVGPPFVVNGGFETGEPDGWLYDPDLVSTTNQGPHGGKWAAWIGLGWGANVMAQKVRVPATGRTTLSAWVFHYCEGFYPDDAQELALYDADVNLLKTVYSQCRNSTSWTEVIVDLTPYAGTEIFLAFDVYDTDDGMITMDFVDDVTIINR